MADKEQSRNEDDVENLFADIDQMEELVRKDSPLQLASEYSSLKSQFKPKTLSKRDIRLEGENDSQADLGAKNPQKNARNATEIKVDQFLIKKQTIVKLNNLHDDGMCMSSANKRPGQDDKASALYKSMDVYFPYNPYQPQREYMTTVLKALANKENAILESPTGTGKTISLLTSCLAFVKKAREKGNKDIKILYMSRTHSQLQQVIQELKKTVYRPKMLVLGSRDHLCINPYLKDQKGNAKKLKCQQLVHQKKCAFNENLKYFTSHYILNTIFDIEDLVDVGNKARICPYYYSKSKMNDRDIIFMPYNYLLDKKYRDQNIEMVRDSILIFDEAHNIQSNAEEGASITISFYDLKACASELEQFIEIDSAKKTDHTIVKSIIRLFNNLAQKIKDRASNKTIKEELEDGTEIFKLFGNCASISSIVAQTDSDEPNSDTKDVFNSGISYSNITLLIDILVSVDQNNKIYLYSNAASSENLNNVVKLIDYFEALKLLWVNYHESSKSLFKEQDITHFRTYYDYSDSNNVKISAWCLNPYYTFRSLLECDPHSVIVTSGTLSPLNIFQQELRIPFRFKYQGKHVIDTKKQVITCVLSKFDSGQPVDISYKSRSNDNIPIEIGKTIVELTNIVPEGMLVFFTSYYMMNTYISKWRAAGIWAKIAPNKKSFIEAREKEGQKLAIDNYIKFHKIGAIFFAVSGGKLSEGIDFSDSMARCVVMVGIPYPNFTDTRVKAKRDYLDKMKPINKAQNIIIDSNTWYSAKALRSTNQAIGRVIRHQKDFGSIVLLDMRFCNKSVEKGLSEWALDNIKKYDVTKTMLKDLKAFYQNIRASHLNGIMEERVEQDIAQDDRNSLGGWADTFRNTIAHLDRNSTTNKVHLTDETAQIIEGDAQAVVGIRASSNKKRSLNMRNCKAMSKNKTSNDETKFDEEKLTKKIPTESKLKSEKKGISCTICFSDDKELWTSKCGHLACIDCWQIYIQKKKECFVCKKKIRSKKQLIRLYC